MGDFATEFQQGIDELYTAFGESITYTTAAGSTISEVSTAVFSPERDEVTFRHSDLSSGGASAPGRGDKITDASSRVYLYPGPESENVDGVNLVVEATYVEDTDEWRIPVRLQA